MTSWWAPLPRSFTSIVHEAVEELRAARRLERLVAAAAGAVRGVPRLHVPRLLQAHPVVVADDGGPVAALRPVPAGRVAARRRIHALRIGPCDDVVHVHRVAAAAHRLSLLRKRGLLVDLVLVRMQIGDVLRHHHAVEVLPRALADAIARVDARLAAGRRGAEIGVPVGVLRACGLRKLVAVRVRAFEAAEIGAVALPDAGDEEGHVPLRLLGILSLGLRRRRDRCYGGGDRRRDSRELHLGSVANGFGRPFNTPPSLRSTRRGIISGRKELRTMAKPTCVVAGVGPGNGAAFARRFASGGYAVALLARGTGLTSKLAGELPDSRAYECDVADAGSVAHAFDSVRRDLGDPEVLIYNAGSGVWGTVEDATPLDFENAWRVNTL